MARTQGSAPPSPVTIAPVERIDFERSWLAPWIREQHVRRYEWAASFVSGADVLDVACGTGYGVPILAAGGAASVTGADLDAATIADAASRIRDDRCRFLIENVTALSFPDASFDVVVSFETIEHIPDDEAYLDEMRRVCRPGGLFLCSTPNRKVMNPGRGIEDGSFNPHHVREYDAAQLSERLARRFRDVQLLGQSSYPPAYVRTLEWVARGSRAAAARAHQAAKVLTAPFTPGERHIVRPVAPLSCPEMLVALARP